MGVTLARRTILVLSELVVPGAGSYSLGHRRRGGAIFGGTAVAIVVAATAAAWGSAIGMWVLAGFGCAVRAFGLFSCFRPALRGRRKRPSSKELAVVLALACAGGLTLQALVKANLVEAFVIPAGSMYPTIVAGDRVMVSKLSRPLERGDIIAFDVPDSGDARNFIKRVVGLPGDRIDFRGDDVILNGNAIERQRVALPCRDTGPCTLFEERLGERRYRVALSRDHEPPASDPVTVPSDRVFVLGDNRHNSFDSRALGPVPLEHVIGRYAFTWWSGSR